MNKTRLNINIVKGNVSGGVKIVRYKLNEFLPITYKNHVIGVAQIEQTNNLPGTLVYNDKNFVININITGKPGNYSADILFSGIIKEKKDIKLEFIPTVINL